VQYKALTDRYPFSAVVERSGIHADATMAAGFQPHVLFRICAAINTISRITPGPRVKRRQTRDFNRTLQHFSRWTPVRKSQIKPPGSRRQTLVFKRHQTPGFRLQTLVFRHKILGSRHRTRGSRHRTRNSRRRIPAYQQRSQRVTQTQN